MAFKMKGNPFQRNFGIGKSPTKLREVYIDGELVGTGKEAVERGLKEEEINERRRRKNEATQKAEFDKALEEGDFTKQSEISEGDKTGKKTKTVTYTGKDAREREEASRGRTTGEKHYGGDVVAKRKDEKKYPYGYKTEEFKTDEAYQKSLKRKEKKDSPGKQTYTGKEAKERKSPGPKRPTPPHDGPGGRRPEPGPRPEPRPRPRPRPRPATGKSPAKQSGVHPEKRKTVDIRPKKSFKETEEKSRKKYTGPRSKGGLLKTDYSKEKEKKRKSKKSPAKCPLLAAIGPVMDMIGKKKE